MENWEEIKSELLVYGIELVDDTSCKSMVDGKLNQRSIYSLQKEYFKDMKENYESLEGIFDSMCKDALPLIKGASLYTVSASDEGLRRVFIKALKSSYKFINFTQKELKYELKYYKVIKKMLNSDVNKFSREFMVSFIDKKIAIDWIYSLIRRQIYIMKLLQIAQIGKAKLNKKSGIIKTAALTTTGGYYHNLMPSMPERVFQWSDVQEETMDRRTDIQKQSRYTMGFDDYNSNKNIGEGFRWKDMSIEPYAWEDRFDESPYKQLMSGTWR